MTFARWLVLLVAPHAAAVFAAAAAPNVVLFVADDQTWHDSGAYGNASLATPSIDRLAAEGMRFTHCFTSTAMCYPSRQQLYTGLFPVRSGGYANFGEVEAGTRSLPHHFGQIGYRVGLAGKRHCGPSESFPFQDVLHRPADLEAFMTSDPESPFFLVVASHNPHRPWTTGRRMPDPMASIDVPPYLVDVPETRDALWRYYAEITELDRELGEVDALLREHDLAESTILIYTSEQGAPFPHAKWTCYDAGLRTALIVRWPGHVPAGHVTDAMVQYVDLLPTLLEAAGRDPAEFGSGRSGAADGGTGFDGRSFLSVLQGRADRHRATVYGVQTTRGVDDGADCYPIRSIRTRTHKLIWNLNFTAPFRNKITTSGNEPGGFWLSWVREAESNPRARSLVEGYLRRPELELYDLTVDPYELHDLSERHDVRSRIDRMKRELETWMEQQGDEGIATEMQVELHR